MVRLLIVLFVILLVVLLAWLTDYLDRLGCFGDDLGLMPGDDDE